MKSPGRQRALLHHSVLPGGPVDVCMQSMVCTGGLAQRPAFTRLVAGVPGLSNRIWLTGPTGSELYQEQLIRCPFPALPLARTVLPSALAPCSWSPHLLRATSAVCS